jgi:hypothetical protein
MGRQAPIGKVGLIDLYLQLNFDSSLFKTSLGWSSPIPSDAFGRG